MVVKDNNVFCDNCGKSLFKTEIYSSVTKRHRSNT